MEKDLQKLMNKINKIFENHNSPYMDSNTAFLSVVFSAKSSNQNIAINDIANEIDLLEEQIKNNIDLNSLTKYLETTNQLLYLAKEEYTKNLKISDEKFENFCKLAELFDYIQYWFPRFYNKYILDWWSDDLDEVLKENVVKYKWHWNCETIKSISDVVPEKIIEKWKRKDPLCQNRAWYNILGDFCAHRVKQKGYNKLYKSQKKVCLLCNKEFTEDSLPYPLVRRLGFDNLDYCPDCMYITYPNTGKKEMSDQDIVKYLQLLVELLKRVPHYQFGERIGDFEFLSQERLTKILELMQNKPSQTCIKEHFGSYLNALIEAEILQDGSRKTSFGVQTIAEDGHVCLSLGEKTIDDYLFQNNIIHSKEPHYPEGNYRADFLVGDYFIEYFGLVGNSDYDKKTKLKKELCKKHNIKLIEIYPKDLLNISLLEKKLLNLN